jgi:hypothetical protein
MNLTVLERLLLLNLIPKEGNVTLLRVLREFQADAGFSSEELEVINFDTDPATGNIRWAPEAATIKKDVKISKAMHAEIVKALARLNEENKLDFQTLELYEKFVPVAEQ